MTEELPPLDDALEAMLSPGRIVADLSPEHQARGLEALAQRIAASPGAAPGEAPPSLASPPAVAATVSGVTKWGYGLGGVLLGAVVGAAAMLVTLPQTAPPPQQGSVMEASPTRAASPSETSPSAAPPSRIAAAKVVIHEIDPTRDMPSIENEGRAQAHQPRTRASRAGTSRPPSRGMTPAVDGHSPTHTPAVDTLLAERRIVDAALAQLRRGRPAEALESVARHEQRFADGQLVEAREVVRIRALVALGRRTEARTALVHFQENFSNSSALSALSTLLDTPLP